MDDRKISVSATCAVAYSAWVVAVALMTLGMVLARADLRALSLMATAVAAVATIRSYMIGLVQQMRNAFDLGQDSVRPIVRRT